jgi:hypothetical protein
MVAQLNIVLLNVMFDFQLKIMFNTEMDDKELIAYHGGPAKLAEKLGYGKDGGVQRVQNWLARGIPPKVKLERPDLFLADLPHLHVADPTTPTNQVSA